MNIYEIDRQIETLLSGIVDEETGEVIFSEDLNRALEQLTMAREEKIENCACAVKNYLSEASAIAAEIKNLTDRKRKLEARADHAKEFLSAALAGEKFSTARVSISYRKSESTEVDGEFVTWAKEHAPELLTVKEPEPNKAAIKKYIKTNGELEYARLVEKASMQIK